MNNLEGKDCRALLGIIEKCHLGDVNEDLFEKIIQELKQLINFEYWGLVYCYIYGEEIIIDELSWFKGIKGFDRVYFEKKLFRKDPVSITAIEMAKSGKSKVLFWSEIYKKYPNSEFYSQIEDFEISKYEGYTGILLPEQTKGIGFSITGPGIKKEKDDRTNEILKIMLPHIHHMAYQGKIGKLTKLTDQQIKVYRMVKDGLSNIQIANVMGITKSGVEKHLEAIGRKTGLNRKKDLTFGFRFNYEEILDEQSQKTLLQKIS